MRVQSSDPWTTVWSGRVDSIVLTPRLRTVSRAILTAFGNLSVLFAAYPRVVRQTNILTSEAISRLLDAVGRPAMARVISTGQTTMRYRAFSTFGEGVNALRDARRVADYRVWPAA